jgi:hypothetical protein
MKKMQTNYDLKSNLLGIISTSYEQKVISKEEFDNASALIYLQSKLNGSLLSKPDLYYYLNTKLPRKFEKIIGDKVPALFQEIQNLGNHPMFSTVVKLPNLTDAYTDAYIDKLPKVLQKFTLLEMIMMDKDDKITKD